MGTSRCCGDKGWVWGGAAVTDAGWRKGGVCGEAEGLIWSLSLPSNLHRGHRHSLIARHGSVLRAGEGCWGSGNGLEGTGNILVRMTMAFCPL